MKQRTRVMHSPDELVGFGMNGIKRNDDNDHEIQLHTVRPQEHFIEAQVLEGDTLQAIALRFHCSISEVKRINQIHKDNEIHARRTIKVPVTPYSILTETLPNNAGNAQPSTSNLTPTHTLTQRNPPNKTDDHLSIDCNAVVMNSTLAPSVTPYTDTETNEPITEDTQLLPNKERIPVETVVVKQLTSQGADFGIKWYYLLCVVIFLGVVIPLVYVMFYLDKPEHSDVPPLHGTR